MMQVSCRVHQFKSNILNDPEAIEIYKLAATIAGQQLTRAVLPLTDCTAAGGPVSRAGRQEKPMPTSLRTGECHMSPIITTGESSATTEVWTTNWTERQGTIYADGNATSPSELGFVYKIEDLGDDLERVLERTSSSRTRSRWTRIRGMVMFLEAADLISFRDGSGWSP